MNSSESRTAAARNYRGMGYSPAASQDVTSAAVVTLIEPTVRSKIEAAGNGLFSAVHAESLHDVMDATRDRRVRCVVMSPHLIKSEDMRLACKLANEFAGTVALTRGDHVGPSNDAHLLALGHCGIKEVVDLTQREGWERLRMLTAEPYPEIRHEICSAIIPVLASATAETVRFFEVLFRVAPGFVSAQQLANVLCVLPSTLMSRFLRHQLPSPKRYLAAVRLLYASALLQTRGASIAEVANRLDYSSSQSFGRHVKTTLHMCASDFRWRYGFERSVIEFKSQLIEPYISAFSSFYPLARPSIPKQPLAFRARQACGVVPPT